MTSFLGSIDAEINPPAVGTELPVDSDATFQVVAKGSMTEALQEDYFNCTVWQVQPATNGYQYQSVAANGELTVHYPANEWVKGTGTWFSLEPVQEMWAGVDLFFPSGHDFVLSGKLGLGLFAGNHNHNSGGGGLDNDDGASVRLHWSNGATTPTIDLYFYWPEMKALNRQYGRTVATSEALVTNTWRRYIIGLNLGTPGLKDGWITLWKREVGGSATEVVTRTGQEVFQLTGTSFDIDLYKFSTFYGGSGAQYAPSTEQTTKFKHFKVGATRASVDDSPQM